MTNGVDVNKPPTLTPRINISAPQIIADAIVSDRQVADYLIIKTLGKGTFGKVKLAEHVVTKQQVAIKIIEKGNIKTQKQKISVDREVRLMKLLNHPHIVGVIEVYETSKFIFIVMEHACNGELFEHIVKHGHIKEQEARRFFRQIFSAMDYCHKNSIIHRDLKVSCHFIRALILNVAREPVAGQKQRNQAN